MTTAYGFRSAAAGFGGIPGRMREYIVASNPTAALAAGDPIALAAGYAVKAVAGNVIEGVAVQFIYNDANGKQVISRLLPAGTTGTIKVEVEEARGQLFTLVADAAVPATAVGKYADINAGTVVTYTSNSGVTLKIASLNAAATGLMVQVLGVLPKEGNADEVVVRFI